METKQVVGYRVQCSNGEFVAYDGDSNFLTYTAPEPISQANAYRRLAAFIEANPGYSIPAVVPVFRQLTPLETASRELGGLLTDLTRRHGLNLGLSQEQIERQIAKELCELGASPVVDRINGIIGR